MKKRSKKQHSKKKFAHAKKNFAKFATNFSYVEFCFFCNAYLRPLNMKPPQMRRLCLVCTPKHPVHVRFSTPARHRTFATCQESRKKKCRLSSFFFSGPTCENGFWREVAMSDTRPFRAQENRQIFKSPPSARAPPVPGRSVPHRCRPSTRAPADPVPLWLPSPKVLPSPMGTR